MFKVLALAVGSALSCVVDTDCGLLGDCLQSQCVCDPGWTGSTCASLDLLPAPSDSGLRQSNSSNWCGTILRDETDPSLFHSYNADFGGCKNGLGIWLTGSRVIHSTASSPTGPYTPRWVDGDAEVAVSGEAHNPQAIRAPDGTYLLMDSYGGPDAGCPLEANYTTCKGTGSACHPKMPSGGTGGVAVYTFHTSSSPAGPWVPVSVSMDYPCYSENLTPSPFFHPNGTLFIVFHCDKDPGHSMCDLTMVRSTGRDWRGPFVRVNDRIWDSAGVSPHPEDPFLFMRVSPTSGQLSYHVILHNTPRGIHLYSEDGLDFKLQQSLNAQLPQPPYVYTEVVNQTDSSSFAAGRRERPWILFTPNTSRPEVLVTSMQSSAWPVVFTHAQQVR
jgi:hypothetical protein